MKCSVVRDTSDYGFLYQNLHRIILQASNHFVSVASTQHSINSLLLLLFVKNNSSSVVITTVTFETVIGIVITDLRA